MLYGLDLRFHPFSLHPSFRPLLDLPLAAKVEAMRDPVLRKQLLFEPPEDSNPVLVATVKAFKFAYPMGETPNYEPDLADRSEEHTSDLQSLMRISYAVFCLKTTNVGSRIFSCVASVCSQ